MNLNLIRATKAFWSNIIVNDGCWGWKGKTYRFGYGMMSYNGRSIRAHRFSYLIHFGEIPQGAFICHRCDNPPCANPRHIYAGDRNTNMQDAYDRGRLWINKNNSVGENNGFSKLTKEKVVEIRAYPHHKNWAKELAIKFGVSTQAIYHVTSGERWVNLDSGERK